MTGTPVRRRHSPAVYRRRRLVLLVAVLAVAAAVWLLIAQPWAGSASEQPEEKPQPKSTAESLPVPSAGTADPAANPSGEATPAEGGPSEAPSPTPTAQPCIARDIAVRAVTSQDSYTGDESPQFSIELTNNGPECTLNVGTSAQSFTVMSGSDVWWRSTDCQTEPSEMVVLLGAGQTVSSAAPLTWDRTRSAVDTCSDSTRPRAPGGGASYHLAVEIGGIPSTESKQFLLY
jgi:cytoskeletal protein RodZ